MESRSALNENASSSVTVSFGIDGLWRILAALFGVSEHNLNEIGQTVPLLLNAMALLQGEESGVFFHPGICNLIACWFARKYECRWPSWGQR